MTNYYGFDSTDDVPEEKTGLPVGTYKVMAVSEDKDEKGNGLIVEYEIVSGENKGRKARVWYNTLHQNQQTANIAKATLKRIADATGKPITPASPIKGRVMTVVVAEQKKNPQYTEVKKYLSESYKEDYLP
jgi:ssDNA-binding Zn-finger/Zn-ribbon topoisomerase 1